MTAAVPGDGPTETVHIVGDVVYVGQLMRQRCAWCGAVLLDYDLALVAVQEGDTGPARFQPGALLGVDGGMKYVVPYAEGDQLPANSCAVLERQAGPRYGTVLIADTQDSGNALLRALGLPPDSTLVVSQPDHLRGQMLLPDAEVLDRTVGMEAVRRAAIDKQLETCKNP